MPDVAARRLTWTGYAALTLVGIYIAALGPGLPSIAGRTGVSLAQAGTLLTAVFAGGLATCIAAGRALDRIGYRYLLITGSITNGLGALLLSLATAWPPALFAAALLGAGDGVMVVGYHVLFADLFPHSSGAALSRLNVFFGLGALAGPALAGASLLLTGDIRYALWLVALGQSGVVALLLYSGLPAGSVSVHVNGGLGLRGLLRRQLLWLLVATIFLYVALEIGLGNWAFTYLRRGGLAIAPASLLSSGFWLALMLGRLCAPLALRRLNEAALLLVMVVATVLFASLLVAAAGHAPTGAVLILLVGFSFGPIWPLAFALATREFRGAAGAATGLIATAGSVSGLAGPWLQGVLLVRLGAQAGMGFTLAGSLGMLIAVLAVHRRLAADDVDTSVPMVADLARGSTRR